jgi:hypothetical protein
MTIALVAACDALIPALDMRKRRNEMRRNETADLSIDDFKICRSLIQQLGESCNTRP